ncbi:MAG TPA: YggS family pyridoxal phosphate-dependent enzyme [Vicinamibacteria bacterium]
MIADRVAAVRERIARAAERAGRPPAEVTLVAVSKTFPAAAVREAFAAGVRDFGENKVQEAEEKAPALAELASAGLRWHLVGHLQSNKARKAAALFDRIHSVDDPALGPRLEKAAAERHRVLPVLVQVDLAGEETKFGLDEERLFPALEALRGLKSVHVEGLMVLPPFDDDPERSRPYFRRLRALRDAAQARQLLTGGHLSMGMSHDFEAAIEEGSTLVRVGSAIFGERAKR